MGRSAALGKWTSVIDGKTYGGKSSLKPFEGDGGHGHGIIQVDDRSHAKFINHFGQDAYARFAEYVAYGTWIFRDFLNQWAKKGYTGETQLKLAFASYNKGTPGSVKVSNPDSGTASGNYASNTYDRWKLFAELLNDWSLPTNTFTPSGVPKNLWPETIATFLPLAADFGRTVKPNPSPQTNIITATDFMVGSKVGGANTPWVFGQQYTGTGTQNGIPGLPTSSPKLDSVLDKVLGTIGAYNAGRTQQEAAQKTDPSLYLLGIVAFTGIALYFRSQK